MSDLLEPVGLGPPASQVYLELLGSANAPATLLAERTGLALPAVEHVLEQLVTCGLVWQVGFRPSTYVALAPEVSIPQLIAKRRDELTQLQVDVDKLAAELSRKVSAEADAPVEEVVGSEAVVTALGQVQSEAREEILIVDAPPYLHDTVSPNEGEFAALAAGVRYRVLYHPDALKDPDAVDQMRRCVAAGEEARILVDPGAKMVVADRRIACIVNSVTHPDPVRRLMVRAPVLVDALVASFEANWERATGVGESDATDSGDDSHEVGDKDRQLLRLLAAGMPDKAIARSLGVTERTVGRRVTELMRRLDADTRFRAGVQAAQKGWL